MDSWKISPYRDASSMQRICAPTSKSYANRLLILAALYPASVQIFDLPTSSDVLTLLDSLKKIGLYISQNTVSNSFPACEPEGAPPLTLFTGDGGTTNRFLLGLLARGKRVYQLNPSGRMLERPVRALLDSLRSLGVRITMSGRGYQIQGPITIPKRITVDASTSSQMASSLALALADTEAEVVPENLSSSQAYWALTEKLVGDFKNDRLNWRVPVDWSGASPLLGLGLLINPVLIENCKVLDPLQADASFIDIIGEMGGHPRWTREGLALSCAHELRAIKVDARHFPDLIPTLSFVCSYARGTSVLTNLSVLRQKESDRLAEIQRLLALFEVPHALTSGDSLEITGPAPRIKRPITYTAPADHRMVMSASLFMRYNGGGTITNAHHVAKSFPHFEKVLKSNSGTAPGHPGIGK